MRKISLNKKSRKYEKMALIDPACLHTGEGGGGGVSVGFFISAILYAILKKNE